MTKEDAISQLHDLSTDNESAHGNADDILLQFLESNGFQEVADAWKFADRKCGGFWYA